MSTDLNNLTQFDKFTIDTQKKVLWYEDEAVELPLKAIELLSLLVENGGELVTKEQILDTVWKDSFVEESVLTQNIYRLRKLFKAHGIKDELIKNVPRRGYRFQGEITDIIEEEVSIERTVVEKNLVVEFEDDEPIPNFNDGQFAKIQTKQIPAQTSQTFFQKNKVAFTGLIVLISFFAIGAGVWFWQSSNNNSRLSLIKGNVNLESLTTSGKAFMPAISRDDQHLAYLRSENNKYSIVLKHIATGSETVVVDPTEIELRSINFSADGNYLYYITREKEYPESTIYKVPIYGGSKRRIISSVRHHFSVSPDGEKFAFYRYDKEKDVTHLMTCKVDGSDEKIIATRKSPEFYQVWEKVPAWSPDGKKFVVSAFERNAESVGAKRLQLFEIDIETGEEKRIKHPDWQHASQAFWTEDGNGLIVSVQEEMDSYSQFWFLSYPDGEATKITNDTNHYPEFTLSNDTKSIIATNRSEHTNLYLVSLDDTDNVQNLTNQTIGYYGMWGVDWTTDGESLVFIKGEGRGDGNVWLMNVKTKEMRQLTFDEKSIARSPKVTPDGKSVLFSSNRSGKRHIWQVDLDGNNLKQITNTENGESYPEISDDGKWIFYRKINFEHGEIWKKPMLGGDAVKVFNTGGVNKVSPTDTDKIIVHHFDNNEKEKSPWKYVIFSHETKSALQHLNINPHNHAIEWNQNGSGIFYAQRNMSLNNLMLHSIKDNKSKQITNFTDQKIVNLDVSPDGKTVALSRGNLTGNILKISGFQQD